MCKYTLFNPDTFQIAILKSLSDIAFSKSGLLFTATELLPYFNTQVPFFVYCTFCLIKKYQKIKAY